MAEKKVFDRSKDCYATGYTGCPGWMGACNMHGQTGDCGKIVPSDEDNRSLRKKKIEEAKAE